MAADTTAAPSTLQQVRTVCAHDCPDACSILVTLEEGRVVRTEGDPEHPFTQGFLCGKVNRYAERVHSPDRLLTPLRRVGAKGEGRFEPITWAAALDEMVTRWQDMIAQYGGEAIAGYAYSAHQGWLTAISPRRCFMRSGPRGSMPVRSATPVMARRGMRRWEWPWVRIRNGCRMPI